MIFVALLSCSAPYTVFYCFPDRKDRQNICSSAPTPSTEFSAFPPAHTKVYCAYGAANLQAMAPM